MTLKINRSPNPIKRFLYPSFFQFITLLALVGFFILTAQKNDFSTLNTGMTIFWNFWWPFIPFVVLLLGRFWCSICPFSAIANGLSKLFPYRFFQSDWFYRYGLFSSLIVYLLIVATHVTFSLEANAMYTILFMSIMVGIMIIMTILFSYKSYCYAVCPMGLFFQLYERFSLAGLNKRAERCDKCATRSWVPQKALFGSRLNQQQPEKHDWRFKVECLKKCETDGTTIELNNPFRKQTGSLPASIIAVLAPGFVLTVFAVSLIEKSNFFLNYYEYISQTRSLSLALVHYTTIPAVAILVLLLNSCIINLFCKITDISRTVVYQKLIGLIPLLIFFHLALVLEEFTGLNTLFYEFPFLTVLDPFFNLFETIPLAALFDPLFAIFGMKFCLPCILTLTGIICALLYGLFTANGSEKGTFNHRLFWLCAVLIVIIVAEYAFFAITTLKLLPYAAC